MTDVKLDPASTDAGAMERLFLVETRDPTRPDYDREQSLKAMRWMKQVVDNRLAAPRKSRFGEPSDATSETDIISVGRQFQDFGNYPTLPTRLASKLDLILNIAASAKDPRGAKYLGFVQDSITAATEKAQPTQARVANLAAWVTQASAPPQGDFKFYSSLQGNDFYTADPVPPRRERRPRHK